MILNRIKKLLPKRVEVITEIVEIERQPALSVEEKKAFVSVLGKKEMKVLWRYLGYKIDLCTREAMQSEDEQETHDFKIASRTFGRIIVDRENFKRDIDQSERTAEIAVPKNVKRTRLFEAPPKDDEEEE